MIDQTFRDALAGYHRRKWFPSHDQDAYGEFIDYVSQNSLERLFLEYEQRSERHFLDVAYYLHRIIPRIKFTELYRDYARALSAGLTSASIKPEHAFYYLRRLPESESRALWDSLRQWCENWETVLHDWQHASIGFVRSHAEQEQILLRAWGWEFERDMAVVERELQHVRPQFEWDVSRLATGADARTVLQSMRFPIWDDTANWTDLKGIAGSVAETCNFHKMPALRKNEREPAVQFLFPIDPPDHVVLEYGESAGPVDTLRFVQEIGKGVFYSSMDSNLPIESRIAGDPALPWFWGLLYCRALAESAGTASIIRHSAEPVSADFLFTLRFWYRYDAMLARYRSDMDVNLDRARDVYLSIFHPFLAMNPAPELYLYDLARSNEAFFRTMAHRASFSAVEELRVRYGTRWFASRPLASRFRDYWRAGYQLTLNEVLRDLNVSLH